MVALRKCSKCGVEKELCPEHFSRRQTNSAGYRTSCKTCDRQRTAEWKRANKERVKEYNKKYKAKLCASLSTQEKEKLKEKLREVSRVRRRENPEKHKAYRKKYYSKNKEKIKLKVAKWNKENPDTLREYVRRSATVSREKLNSCYIRAFLTAGTTLKAKDIPQELVDAKRLQLMITRKIKELEG